ncbi:MAG: enolase [Candidatus Micrarchaeota archaeon]
MSRIESIHADWVLDSRGEPTVEVTAHLDNGIEADAISPSGRSNGKHEAKPLLDKNPEMFLGKGVQKAVNNVNTHIARALNGMPIWDQRAIDMRLRTLDWEVAMEGGISQADYGRFLKYSMLGANATTAVSMACLKAAAKDGGVPLYKYLGGNVLPVPFFNVINGGQHAGNKDLAIQEFMVVPIRFKTFEDAFRAGAEVYQRLKKIITRRYGKMGTNVGDERGFVPPIKTTNEALDLLKEAIQAAHYEGRVFIALDCAATTFYNKKSRLYHIDGQDLNRLQMLDYYEERSVAYPELISIEDPFHEEDFKSFAILTVRIGDRVQTVSDDLTVTQLERLKKAHAEVAKQRLKREHADEVAKRVERLELMRDNTGSGAFRGEASQAGGIGAAGKSVEGNEEFDLLVKINQVGDITGAFECVEYCKENGLGTMSSHRSGEGIKDTTIAHLVVGWNAGQIKAGAPAGERNAKYNELLCIERHLGENGLSSYAGQCVPACLRKKQILKSAR